MQCVLCAEVNQGVLVKVSNPTGPLRSVSEAFQKYPVFLFVKDAATRVNLHRAAVGDPKSGILVEFQNKTPCARKQPNEKLMNNIAYLHI